MEARSADNIGKIPFYKFTDSQLKVLQEVKADGFNSTQAEKGGIARLDGSLAQVKPLTSDQLVKWGLEITTWPKWYALLLNSRAPRLKGHAEAHLKRLTVNLLRKAGLSEPFNKASSVARQSIASPQSKGGQDDSADVSVKIHPMSIGVALALDKESNRRAFIKALTSKEASWPSLLMDQSTVSEVKSLGSRPSSRLQSAQLGKVERLITHWPKLNGLFEASGLEADEFAAHMKNAFSLEQAEGGVPDFSSAGQGQFDAGWLRLVESVSGANEIREILGVELGEAVLAGLRSDPQYAEDPYPIYTKHEAIQGFKELKEIVNSLGNADKSIVSSEFNRVVESFLRERTANESKILSPADLAILVAQFRCVVDLGQWRNGKNDMTAQKNAPQFYLAGEKYLTRLIGKDAEPSAPPPRFDYIELRGKSPDKQLQAMLPSIFEDFASLKSSYIEDQLKNFGEGATLAAIESKLRALQDDNARMQKWVEALDEKKGLVARTLVLELGPKLLFGDPVQPPPESLPKLKAVREYTAKVLKGWRTEAGKPDDRARALLNGVTAWIKEKELSGITLDVQGKLDAKQILEIRPYYLKAYARIVAVQWYQEKSGIVPLHDPNLDGLLDQFTSPAEVVKEETLAYLKAFVQSAMPLLVNIPDFTVEQLKVDMDLATINKKATADITKAQKAMVDALAKLQSDSQAIKPTYALLLHHIINQPATSLQVFLSASVIHSFPDMKSDERERFSAALATIRDQIGKGRLDLTRFSSGVDAGQIQSYLPMLNILLGASKIDSASSGTIFQMVLEVFQSNIQQVQQLQDLAGQVLPNQLSELNPPVNLILPPLLEWITGARRLPKSVGKFKKLNPGANEQALQAYEDSKKASDSTRKTLKLVRSWLPTLVSLGQTVTKLGFTRRIILKQIEPIIKSLPLDENEQAVIIAALPAILDVFMKVDFRQGSAADLLQHLQDLLLHTEAALDPNTKEFNERDYCAQVLTDIQCLVGDVFSAGPAVFAGLEAVASIRGE